SEEVEIPRIGHRLPRLQHERGIERIQHRPQAAEVIEMRVGRHDRRQLSRASLAQKRHHDSAAGVASWSARPAVDQQPPPRRTAQRNRIPLSDVQETYGKTMTV